MLQQVTFEGVAFTKDKFGYYRSPRRKDLHVAVWESHHGCPVPAGHEIHHVDHDKENNEPSNLQCLTISEHKLLHWREDDGRLLAAVRRNIEKARVAASVWHGSPEGRQWHSEHAKRVAAAHVGVERACERCTKAFIDQSMRGFGKFCSGACKTAARFASGVDNVKLKCEWCSTEFEANKYSKARFCSQTCVNYNRWRRD